MSNNMFYKALAAVSTAGIIVIAGMQVTTALKKGNTSDDQLAKTMVEIKNARKDALREVKAAKIEVINSLKRETSSRSSGAESVWLVYTDDDDDSWISIPMESMDQCEESGATLKSSERLTNTSLKSRGYECIYGGGR